MREGYIPMLDNNNWIYKARKGLIDNSMGIIRACKEFERLKTKVYYELSKYGMNFKAKKEDTTLRVFTPPETANSNISGVFKSSENRDSVLCAPFTLRNFLIKKILFEYWPIVHNTIIPTFFSCVLKSHFCLCPSEQNTFL